MRFLADMGVSGRIVTWLREQSHDVVHLRDQGLQRLPNGQIFEKAFDEQRVILTFDLDFAEIVALSAGKVVSVILFRLNNTKTEFVWTRLLTVLSDCSAMLESGAIIVVEDGRHRIRRLPLGK